MGINTGEVLAGEVGDSYTVIGDTVNVASRLQAAARPGSVTVGERTYRATREAIDYRALAQPLILKGKSEPVPAWEALAVDERPLVSAAAAPAGTPLVGRTSELAQLHDLHARVQRKRGPHLVTVIGEAGVGKTRLLRQFEARAAEPRTATAGATRALPAVRLEHRLLAARRDDSRRVRDRRRRLRPRLLGRSSPRGWAGCSTVADADEPLASPRKRP